MLITFFRAIILYVLVLVVMRVMGKREIGQLQPFELAISIMIADLATIPMADVGIPITNGIIAMLSLLIMHLLISFINLKSMRMRALICGKPRILIYRGKIQEEALVKERFTINELEERLRGNNVMNLGDVEYAILETSGQISVIQKPNKRTVTPEDLDIEPPYEGISYDLVIDGRILDNNLQAPPTVDDDDLKSMIEAITINSKLGETGDLLDDLKTIHVSNLKEEIEEKEEVPKDSEIDRSFFTSSLGFTNDDFEDLKEMKDSLKTNNIFTKILLFILLVVIVTGVMFLVYHFMQ